MLFASLFANLFVVNVPSYLLMIDVVQLLDNLVCFVTKRQNGEVANPVKHVVVIGSPLVAVHDVVLLVLSELGTGKRM